MPPGERERLGLNPVATDSRMGPETFEGFKTLTNNGYGAELRDRLAARRLADLARPAANGGAGDVPRIDHFR